MRPLTPAQRTALGMLAVSGRWLRPLPGMKRAYDQLVELELAAKAWTTPARTEHVYCLTVAGARAAKERRARPIVIDIGGML